MPPVLDLLDENLVEEDDDEEYVINHDLFGPYKSYAAMAKAVAKDDILVIVNSLALIGRRHRCLLQHLTTNVVKNLHLWSAPDLAELCKCLLQLGYLHEDLCVAMADRVLLTVEQCSASELCWLLDAYAATRCSVDSVVAAIAEESTSKVHKFRIEELARHASSFARLHASGHQDLIDMLAQQLIQHLEVANLSPAVPQQFVDRGFIARDLTVAADAFSRLFNEADCRPVFRALAPAVTVVARDFTAKDLQVLLTAMCRANYRDEALLQLLAAKVLWRISQFDAEALVLTIRAFAFFGMSEKVLPTTVCHMPRFILRFKPADVITLLNTVAAAGVHSEALLDILTQRILELAPWFSTQDWHMMHQAYQSLGHQDALFQSAFVLHSKDQMDAALLK